MKLSSSFYYNYMTVTRPMKYKLFFILLICFFIAPSMNGKTGQSHAWRVLREGGIALIRHTHAPGTGDPADFNLEDCGTQRNLSNEGREQAKRIGERFRSENVTVDLVLHSVWCRTRDTSELAFPDRGKPEPAINSFFHNPETEPKQTKQTKEIISSWRGPGALVLVTHQVNITALTGIFPKEGEAIILQPLIDEYEIAGKISF